MKSSCEYNYRWMEKDDLEFFEKEVLDCVKNPKNIAYVVEHKNDFIGVVIYNKNNNFINIVNIGFKDENVFEFIISEIKNKFDKIIKISICEYDLKMQLLLKKLNFRAISIENKYEETYYVFSSN